MHARASRKAGVTGQTWAGRATAWRMGLAALGAAGWLLAAGCGEALPPKPVQEADPDEPAEIPARPVTGKKVLVVHSYHTEYPWVAAITRGIEKGLDGTGVGLDFFYMDTKRKTEEAWKVRAGELALRKVSEDKPDLVIAVDDNAQQYFAMKYVGAALPVVFCGVNEDPSKYGFPASNITGIIERPHFVSTLKYLARLRPVKKVAVLSDDSETSAGALRFMKEDFTDVEVAEFKMVRDFAAWKEAVLRYNDTVDAFGVYMYHTIKDGVDPQSMEPKTVMRWTAENAKVPTFGFFEFGVEDGLLIGVVESGLEYGEKAAAYALEMLRGTPIASLPVIKAHVGLRMVNRETAERLNLTLGDEVTRGARLVPEN